MPEPQISTLVNDIGIDGFKDVPIAQLSSFQRAKAKFFMQPEIEAVDNKLGKHLCVRSVGMLAKKSLRSKNTCQKLILLFSIASNLLKYGRPSFYFTLNQV